MTQIPLMVAAANGYCDIAQLLVDKGANVNVQVGTIVLVQAFILMYLIM